MKPKLTSIIKISTLTICLGSSGAQATFVAAIFNDDTFVIGADSRRMTEGGPVDDTFCKIIVLTNQAVFTMLGVPSVAIGTQGLNIFDLNRQAAIGTTNLSEMARRFGSMATSELNRINPQLRSMPPVKAALRTGCAGESCEYS